ncbi:MAG: amidohydrolase family protein [Isosphaeraceae bacterium]
MTQKPAEAPTIDVCGHCGPFTSRPVGVEPDGLRDLLAPYGVVKAYAGRLEALWYENPHDANRLPMAVAATGGGPEVVAVPVLDPTIATWREELDRLAAAGPLTMVRLWPSYHRFRLSQAGPLLDALAKRGTVVQVIARVEDPRRQHPLAQVADVSAAEVRDAARRHPSMRVLLSGATTQALLGLANGLPRSNNLWADVSQTDGAEAILDLTASPWAERLVFGTHAPIFVPEAAFARVLTDLDDFTAGTILHGNAAGLFG